MTTATKPPLARTDEELVELLSLMKGSDSVELKLTIPASDHRATINALGMDPLEAQIRQVFFFDTSTCSSTSTASFRAPAGCRARATTRSCSCDRSSPASFRPRCVARRASASRSTPCRAGTCSGSMKAVLESTAVREAALGKRPLRKLFTKEQRAFYAEHAPDGIGLDDLSILGPIFVLKLKFTPKEFPRKLVAEMAYLMYRGAELGQAGCSRGFPAAAESRPPDRAGRSPLRRAGDQDAPVPEHFGSCVEGGASTRPSEAR